MFWKKKKKDNSEEIITKFNSYFISSHKSDYEEVEKIHNHIKLVYLRKIDNKEIDISIEKLRLKRKLGKFQSHKVQFNVSYYMVLIGIFFTSILDIGFNDGENKYTSLKIIFVFIMFGWLTVLLMKDSKKDNVESKADFMSFEILEEIEKDLENRKKLEPTKAENKSPNYEDLREIAITTSTGVFANIISSGVIRKLFKRK